MDLVAYKDESVKTREIAKAELHDINILLQSSCREPPKIFMRIANKLRAVKNYQKKLGKEIQKYHLDLQVLFNDSIIIEGIRKNRSIVMQKWKKEKIEHWILKKLTKRT